ncbi:MAG: PAS domain-containing protein, partial [Caulobacteraceae bacterium]
MTAPDIKSLSRTELEAEVLRFRGEANATGRNSPSQAASLDKALAAAEQRYRALFEAIDDGFCVIEFIDGPHGPLSDCVHVEANAGYERHTGIHGIVGKTLREIAPDDASGWLELYGSVLRTGRPIRFEREFTAVERHIEVSAARLEPSQRRQISVLFRDVTARKRAEASALQNAERMQLALTAGAIIGTWHWDIAANWFTIDESFAAAFGLDPALGREGLDFDQVLVSVHPEDKEGMVAAVQEALSRGGPYAYQYRVRRDDGRYHWIEANGRVDVAPDGAPLRFPGVLVDIEDRRAVLEERDRTALALRALNETLE